MLKRAIAASFVVLSFTKIAYAGDAVVLDCDFPEQNGEGRHWDHVVADRNGITITTYMTNEKTGKTTYVRSYTENKEESGQKSTYHMNSAEISWSDSYTMFQDKITGYIDLETGVMKIDMQFFKPPSQRPTETGLCTITKK